ncbi:MAG: hypothetical protein ACI4IL_03095 [Eubacterium sp.]
MKRVISFLMIFVIMLLCSCSFPKEIEESVNLDLDFLQDKTITNIDNNDRYILIRCIPFVEEEFEPSYELSYYYVWDIERNKLKSSLEQKENYDDDNYISEIEINEENQITLYTYNAPKQSRVYDLSFKQTGYCNGSYVANEEKRNSVMKGNGLINPNRFAYYDNFATDSYYISNTVGIFGDDPDNVYISDYDNEFNVNSTNGKLVLSSFYEANGTSITYRLTDYEALVKREIEVEYGKYTYPGISSMSDKYTVVDVRDESGKSSTITVINNSCGNASTANIVRIPSTDIDSKISSTVKELENTYGIEIEIAEEYDENSIINEYFYENDYTKAQILLTMYDFKKCVSTFPNEYYSEIISSETGFDKLKFYFVGSFDAEKNSNDISAYCSNINDELFIVYSVNGFTYSTFCHELMHAMEYRINDNVPDFYYDWEQLNPKGFEYIYFNSESVPFYDNEENQKYFAREYGTNNELEDRATVFEEVCDSDFNNEKSPWWAEYKPLSKKASYLKKAIRKSFPSLSNLWEKYDSIL